MTPDLIVDACTLNNVINAVQLAILIALLRWVRGPSDQSSRTGPDEKR